MSKRSKRLHPGIRENVTPDLYPAFRAANRELDPALSEKFFEREESSGIVALALRASRA
jgi:hypothetical protein